MPTKKNVRVPVWINPRWGDLDGPPSSMLTYIDCDQMSRIYDNEVLATLSKGKEDGVESFVVVTATKPRTKDSKDTVVNCAILFQWEDEDESGQEGEWIPYFILDNVNVGEDSDLIDLVPTAFGYRTPHTFEKAMGVDKPPKNRKRNAAGALEYKPEVIVPFWLWIEHEIEQKENQ